MATPHPTLSSREAAQLLGIKVETLYAYAARGLVQGLPGPRGRGRRYRREDLEPLRVRSAGPAASALRFGEPVLETRISGITPLGPRYRGRPVLALLDERCSFEAVAELLWTGSLPSTAAPWPSPPSSSPSRLAGLARWLPAGSPGLAVLGLALPALALADPLRFDAEPAAVINRARGLIPRLAACAAFAVDPRRLGNALLSTDPALVLARAIGAPDHRGALDLLRATLVLSADHELNASTFAARVAASTGADLHACIGAALAAFSGPRHGGASEQVERLVAAAGSPKRAAAAMGEWLRRGDRLPAFGHPLYPQGDPRTPPLIDRALALSPRAPRLRTLLALVDAVRDSGRPPPNLDIGVAAVCMALDLPPGLGPTIFAIGRTAGWVAHVLEQQQSSAVLRPRARYIGDESP